MDCSVICLFALTVNFRSSNTTTSCDYCVDTRSTYKDCFDNVLECAYRDPDGLILCLNTYENSETGTLEKSTKCLSYKDFYISDPDILRAVDVGSCDFGTMQKCECAETCPRRVTTTTTVRSTTKRKITPQAFTSDEKNPDNIPRKKESPQERSITQKSLDPQRQHGSSSIFPFSSLATTSNTVYLSLIFVIFSLLFLLR
ncbi:unnamed protein product, partial [Mesorhabditis belari]|uniref:Uncharacterized protein n=1 Tax=Mesorhabditis belari TaxID=2138241 RepID=A0AAF3J943_9BILA